jgi:7-cyano-7-deazaguanine synthase
LIARLKHTRERVEKIAVLASGGLDSSILIAKIASDADVHPIYVRCGLKWEDVELAALQSFLDRYRHVADRVCR